jgi:hypothetical protein
MGIDVAFFVEQLLDQLLVADDNGGVVVSFERKKAAILLGPLGEPTRIT